MSEAAIDLLSNQGKVRTDVHCHNCSRTFIGILDYDLEGNHEIICPHCSHSHYRVIKKGKITDDRYDSSMATHVAPTRSVWQPEVLASKIQTNTVSAFLRDRWLNRSDVQD